ncbi:MAG: CAP domain-containing protein [Myxococcota bacterium]
MRAFATVCLLGLMACEGGLIFTNEGTAGGGGEPRPMPMPMPGEDAGIVLLDSGPAEDSGAPTDPEDAGTPPEDAAPPPADAAPPPEDTGPVDPVDPPPPAPADCEGPEEAAVRALANEARAADGTGPLACDPLMAQVARAHGQDMCDEGYFAHNSQDGSTPFDRMREAGVSYGTAGENIARGQRTPDAVHTGWMNSSGHRRNILNDRFGRIGIGYVACPSGRGPFWVQVFAN